MWLLWSGLLPSKRLMPRPVEGLVPPKDLRAGSNPALGATYAGKAETAQQILGKDERRGATPCSGTRLNQYAMYW